MIRRVPLIFLVPAFALVTSDWSMAAETARLEKFDGAIKIHRAGRVLAPVVRGEIKWLDKIEGQAGASAVVRFPKETMTFQGPFSISIEPPPGGSPLPIVSLFYGKLRAVVLALAAKREHSITVVKTPGATMGVRGTDFFASYDALLGESEVICFDHEIELAAVKANSPVVVKGGQWGGLGGRFGETIRPPMTLPRNVLESFKDRFPL